MQGKVFDYFVNLEKTKLPRRKGAILFNDDSKYILPIDKVKNDTIDHLYIDGHKYYSKPVTNGDGIIGIAASRMYNDIGILTPPYYVMKQRDRTEDHAIIRNVTQDVMSIDGLESSIAYNFEIDKKCFDHFFEIDKDDKWAILSNECLRNIFLEFMTPECLDELIGLYLVDEIRLDGDRHTGNYFVCKHKDSEKYEHIVPIDLDYFSLLKRLDDTPFEKAATKSFPTYTPQDALDYNSYDDRVKEILNHIDAGNFSEANVELLKRALSYNFPKEVKSVCKEYRDIRRYKDNLYNKVSDLWEYNDQNLGRELGL